MAAQISFDLKKQKGRIKPLHGVNNSPVVLNDKIPSFTDAGIPYMRTHDSAGQFGGAHYVDIPNIFPDFNADENLPESYDFAFTDAYLSSVVASGTKIFYRLGVTIENNWKIKAYNINPPKDYAKWARICEHVIRHYNEGWADGYHFGIEYWEIWNEPENPSMWTGTREQFFSLYSTAANHLKKCFPDIKVGGYAGCGFYYVTGTTTDDFLKSFVSFFDEFLDYIKAPETAAPLDFYSWHIYTADASLIARHAEYVRNKLDEKGLADTEHFLNEWNRTDGNTPETFEEMRENKGASFCAHVMNIMQESSIDKAMYYDAYPMRRYCGLYTFPAYRLTKTYYAFYAFNRLYRLRGCVGTKVFEDTNVSASAASNGTEHAILLANYGEKEARVSLDIKGTEKDRLFDMYLIDAVHCFEKSGETDISKNSDISLPPYSVTLLELTDQQDKRSSAWRMTKA